jgi:hypothetical protein
MFNKHHYIRKSLPMSFSKQCFRNIFLIKKYFLIIIIFFFIILILFLNQKNRLCDPTQPLWWFCPWPDPQETVCSWDQHFPKLNEKIRYLFSHFSPIKF